MPEEKKTVDIDTSGPEVNVQLPEEKEEDTTYENETTVQDKSEAANTSEKSDVSADVQESKQEDTKEEKVEAEAKEEKDELKEYSESVQKRIAKLTKKWREAERQKEEAITYAQSIMKAKKEADKKISTLEPSVLKTTEESIKSGMAAKAKLAAAREANDLGAETEAMSAISELGYKQAKFLEAKNAQEEFNKNKQTEVKTPADMSQKPFAKTPAPDPKAEAWSEKNEWFGKDSAMTYTAFDLHKKLTEEEGFDPTSDEYYSEIDKRIRLEFPHKFGSNTDK